MLMVATILILSLDELFPMGFGLVLSGVFPVLPFLKARNLGAGSFRGPPFWISLACSPHENFSWLLSQPPFRLGGGGGGGEREKRIKEEYLINLYSRNPLYSAINLVHF